MKNQITRYVEDNYDYNTPILTFEIRKHHADIKDGTIRQILRRLKNDNILKHAGPGVYYKPKKTGILNTSYIKVDQIIKKKYLYNNDNKVIGYITGVNLANELSLTTQTSFLMEVVSNNVSNKKRTINISNRKITLKAPRVKITSDNYKLLQVLDILTSFDKYSEIDIFTARPKLLKHLSNIKLTEYEVEDIVSNYPILTQLNFYKLISSKFN